MKQLQDTNAPKKKKETVINMVIAFIFQTVEKKRVKALSHDPLSEFKLLKENHKKDKLIQFLEEELEKNV